MKTVILCGGQGTRIQGATGGLKPKPMVEVGGRPILWHIMKTYAHYGFKDFVLCLGHLGSIIKDYFLHYEAQNSDLTLHLGSRGEICYHNPHDEADWTVTLADTGLEVMTGARVAKIKRYLANETFMLTYGDGVADIDLHKLLAFHRSHGRIATVTGVRLGGRFGRLDTVDNQVRTFKEKPEAEEGDKVNGGYFVFEPAMFDYLSPDPTCILERGPLERIALEGQLMMYSHDGFWQCMDTYRDLIQLEHLWNSGTPPWRVWADEFLMPERPTPDSLVFQAPYRESRN